MEHSLARRYSRLQNIIVDVPDNDIMGHMGTTRKNYHDPLVSTDSEDMEPEEPPQEKKKSWKDKFNARLNKKPEVQIRRGVPGYYPVPRYPQQSTLTPKQHYKMLQGLDQDAPPQMDEEVLKNINEIYKKEQDEFKRWAKTMWTTTHYRRTLNPPQLVDKIYDEDFHAASHRLRGLPNKLKLVARIAFESEARCELSHVDCLIPVNFKFLPEIEVPIISSIINVLTPFVESEPCPVHPCQFILPNTTEQTELNIADVQRELAVFAVEKEAHLITSEEALRCFMEVNRPWSILVSVCGSTLPGGEVINAIVLDAEYPLRQEAAVVRTRKVFEKMLEQTLVPPSKKQEAAMRREKVKMALAQAKRDLAARDRPSTSSSVAQNIKADTVNNNLEPKEEKTEAKKEEIKEEQNEEKIEKQKEGEEEEEEGEKEEPPEGQNEEKKENKKEVKKKTIKEIKKELKNEIIKEIKKEIKKQDDKKQGKKSDEKKEENNKEEIKEENKGEEKKPGCTCKEAIDLPVPRSYQQYDIHNQKAHKQYSLIIHVPHRARYERREMMMEPVPEYQLDLGATEPAMDLVRRRAVGIMLRQHTSILSSRINGETGELVAIDIEGFRAFEQKHNDIIKEVQNRLYNLIHNLQGVKPGHYVLHREMKDGNTGTLYELVSTEEEESTTETLVNVPLTAEDEDGGGGKMETPTITDTLLPLHRLRSQLPAAFTPHENQVVPEPQPGPSTSQPRNTRHKHKKRTQDRSPRPPQPPTKPIRKYWRRNKRKRE